MDGRPALPVDAVLPAVLAALAEHGIAVLQAPPGAGKTTRVPAALLDAGLAGSGAVVVLQPRRLAARATARFVAAERGVALGGEVGYHVRGERRASAATRLLAVTEGLFVRRVGDDPFLSGVGAVVFDEFHERHLDGDLALAMVRRVREQARPDLVLLVMSATLPAEAIASALGGAPVVRSEGRLHPVTVRHLQQPLDLPLEQQVARVLLPLLDETGGDVLVFLPGVGEIERTARQLAPLAAERGLLLHALHGSLPLHEQDRALAAGPRRKVVLATNVAETSVTVEGVTAVIDSGTARFSRFRPDLGFDQLVLAPISLASADQRAGRAGRLAPGICGRLWTAAEHRNRPADTPPEIERVDLAPAVLALLAWGERDPAAAPWLTPPPAPALARASATLVRLGALSGGQLTALGRQLARLPVAPRLGRLLLEGRARGVPERAARAAAILSERRGPDVADATRGARGPGPGERPPRRAQHRSRSDLLDRVLADEERFGPLGAHRPRTGREAEIGRTAEQLLRLAAAPDDRSDGPPPRAPAEPAHAGPAADDALLVAIFAAYADRLARRREAGSARAVMVGGRGVELSPRSAVTGAELFVCLELDAGAPGSRGDARVELASEVARAWIPESALSSRVELLFDEASASVVARRRVLYDDLLLEESPAPLPDDEAVAAVLLAAARERLPEVLPRPGDPVETLLVRLQFLRAHMPELSLPEPGPDALLELLPALCRGRRSLAELRGADWAAALAARLSPAQHAALQLHAPERLAVPSGSRVALRWEAGRAPILPVRIQELFGCDATPRVAGGRVAVLLELLGPNHHPQQVTDDLPGFWRRTYPAVRKELRRRYPRHAWPDDPLAAAPERRPQRRRT